MVTRSWLRFRSPALADVAVPLFEARGARDGPTLTLLAGIHGCEYASMAAVRAFMRDIERAPLSGRIRALPIVDLSAFRTRSPFVSPADGKNLNRCFPGDPAGTVTDQLAHEVFTSLILGSDAVVDLHAGDAAGVDDDLVFRAPGGGWLTPERFTRVMDDLILESRVRRITPNGLRHVGSLLAREIRLT